MIKSRMQRIKIGPSLFLTGCLVTVTPAQIVDQGPPPGIASIPASDEIRDATNRLKQGEFFPADVDLLVKTNWQKAVPDLKKQFSLTRDPVLKGSVASALVKLADPDPASWDYLVQGTAEAVTSNAPSPQRFDAKGKQMPGLSPEIIAWSKINHLSESDLDDMLYDFFSKVAFLGNTGDRRAIPLLRQALLSPNYLIQASAADGLMQLKDKDSIPLIIQACRQAPAEAASVISNALSDTDDPQAQNAAIEFKLKNTPK